MSITKSAEAVLQELGITEANEIDLEAIAWHLGAKVRYRPLDGCEARIIGNGDNAIITINNRNSTSRRQRFSLAHELGHWIHHRGKLLVCRAEEIGKVGNGSINNERIADRYASDLLLPHYIFKPIAKTYPKLSFKVIGELADLFDVSKTAVAIRFIEGRYFPALLVCHGHNGRKWFFRSPDVPDRWFPQSDLDSASFAFNVLFGSAAEDSFPRKIGADAWFDSKEAQYYEIQEQTIRTAEQEIITLLLINDEKMLRG